MNTPTLKETMAIVVAAADDEDLGPELQALMEPGDHEVADALARAAGGDKELNSFLDTIVTVAMGQTPGSGKQIAFNALKLGALLAKRGEL